MKKLLPILLLAIALSLVLWKLSKYPAFHDRQDPAGLRKQSTVEQSHESLEVSDSAETHGNLSKTRSVPAVVTLKDIPDGSFRSELKQLDPEVQKKVIQKICEKPQLLHDINSIHVDQNGMIFYICKMEKSEPVPTETATAESGSFIEYPVFNGPVSNSSPPAFHSRPGSSKVLFLDFNGHNISGTAWNSNSNFAMPSTWYCYPYDTDGDILEFSVEEQEIIYQVWLRVAEDYAPFNVDVTTEQPSVWTRTTGHALITRDHDANGVACPHDGAGGIGYLDVFGESWYSYNYSGECASPVWVQDYPDAGDVAEVISHELGHNLGLSHDGLENSSGETIDEYYDGHQNGSISWGAIMGSAYGRNVTQWSKGEYYRANNTEDDLAIIAGKLAYIADDYGDFSSSSTSLTVVSEETLSVTGRVETTDDPDVFFITVSPAMVITVTVQVAEQSLGSWGANLDALFEVQDSLGNSIISTNGELELSTSAQIEVLPGTYYLHVRPVGVGNPLSSTPTGYTSYGSLGQYVLKISSALVEPDADYDGLPNTWEIEFFGGATNAVADTDSDGDGFSNLQEYISGFNPTSSASFFHLTDSTTGTNGFIVSWIAVSGRVYSVNWTTNLLSSFQSLETNILSPQSSWTDTVHNSEADGFYRVDVQLAE